MTRGQAGAIKRRARYRMSLCQNLDLRATAQSCKAGNQSQPLKHPISTSLRFPFACLANKRRKVATPGFADWESRPVGLFVLRSGCQVHSAQQVVKARVRSKIVQHWFGPDKRNPALPI